MCPCNKCVVLAICNEPCENFIRYALRWKRRAIQIKFAILFIFVSIVFTFSLIYKGPEPQNLLLVSIIVFATLALIGSLINEYCYIPRSLKRRLNKLPHDKLVKEGLFSYPYI